MPTQRQRHRLLSAMLRFFGGVRIRMTLWYLLVLAIVFVVFGGIVLATTIQREQNAEREGLISLATQLIASYDPTTDALGLQDPWGDPSALKTGTPVHISPDTPFLPTDLALLLDAHGALAQRFGPLTDQAAATVRALALQHASANPSVGDFVTTGLLVEDFGKQRTELYTLHFAQIIAGSRHTAILVVGRPAQDGRSVSTLLPGLLIAGPLTLLVAALGGYWLATRAMHPVRLITRTAREIGETDLSRRLNVARRDELGELAVTFDGMLARLEAAFARQRQFTADASHELRTPLTIIGLEAGRALEGMRSPDEYVQALAVIQAENAYMGQLVENLLTLARADAGHTCLHVERHDMSDLALEAVERLAPVARASGLTLSAGPLPELPITGDRTILTQMLANLVENAIKHSRGFGTRVTVETGRLDRDGREEAMAWVRVTDDGPGIAAEHLPLLFDRFYRVDAARVRDAHGGDGPTVGSGLGLAIVRWAAEAHGGAVRVESVVGRGSVFEVRLPLRRP
jgi:signal transduction histidine kinase